MNPSDQNPTIGPSSDSDLPASPNPQIIAPSQPTRIPVLSVEPDASKPMPTIASETDTSSQTSTPVPPSEPAPSIPTPPIVSSHTSSPIMPETPSPISTETSSMPDNNSSPVRPAAEHNTESSIPAENHVTPRPFQITVLDNVTSISAASLSTPAEIPDAVPENESSDSAADTDPGLEPFPSALMPDTNTQPAATSAPDVHETAPDLAPENERAQLAASSVPDIQVPAPAPAAEHHETSAPEEHQSDIASQSNEMPATLDPNLGSQLPSADKQLSTLPPALAVDSMQSTVVMGDVTPPLPKVNKSTGLKILLGSIILLFIIGGALVYIFFFRNTDSTKVNATSRAFIDHLFINKDYAAFKSTINNKLTQDLNEESYNTAFSYSDDYDCRDTKHIRQEIKGDKAIVEYSLKCNDGPDGKEQVTYFLLKLEKVDDDWVTSDFIYSFQASELESITIDKAFEASYSQSEQSTSDNGSAADTERTNDIKALHGQLEAYYAQFGYYPTLANMNDSTWRATYMKGLDSEALKDPAGSAATLAAVPEVKKYSYDVKGTGSATCDNSTSNCTSYTLTATLDAGGTFVKTNLN